jgi:hypothetical protein
MKIFLRFVTLLLLFSLNFSNSNGQNLLVNKSPTTSENSTTVFFDNLSSEIIIKNFVEGKYLVQVFNLTGTEIIRHDSLRTNMARIPALNLRNGVYLVRITPTINQASATFKIVVR